MYGYIKLKCSILWEIEKHKSSIKIQNNICHAKVHESGKSDYSKDNSTLKFFAFKFAY